MENQRNVLLIALIAITAVIYFKWVDFTTPQNTQQINSAQVNSANISSAAQADNIPSVPLGDVTGSSEDAPQVLGSEGALLLPDAQSEQTVDSTKIITVTTDMVVATINTVGGVIQGLELIKEPISVERKDEGFPLLKQTRSEIFIVEDGLAAAGEQAPNHKTQYQSQAKNYDLGSGDKVDVVLKWTSETGVNYTKTITFHRNSYVVDVNYQVNNPTAKTWSGIFYGRFARTEPQSSGGGFGQLPSYVGGATYTEEDKYQKIDFDEIAETKFTKTEKTGWVAMLQHYFVGAWIPDPTSFEFTTSANNSVYRLGYKHKDLTKVAPGGNGVISSRLFLGPKEQSRLKRLEDQNNINGLALTVDYGWLTFIADPLFSVLSFIHSIVGNWGWAIIILTFLIKAVFYPLSAASYKSMAGMKKLQPRSWWLFTNFSSNSCVYCFVLGFTGKC